MRLQDAINETHKRITDTLEQFSELIDPEWIQQALEYTGKASIEDVSYLPNTLFG